MWRLMSPMQRLRPVAPTARTHALQHIPVVAVLPGPRHERQLHLVLPTLQLATATVMPGAGRA